MCVYKEIYYFEIHKELTNKELAHMSMIIIAKSTGWVSNSPKRADSTVPIWLPRPENEDRAGVSIWVER